MPQILDVGQGRLIRLHLCSSGLHREPCATDRHMALGDEPRIYTSLVRA